MGRLGLIFFFFGIFLFPAAAQLPNGSIAPDFEVQDINGQSQHLYDLLAQDKIVILEISATWCPPCWSYHQSHALQELYAAHGPTGDDKIRALWVEGDPATNLACIYGQSGCNSQSSGDFATGTPYPILNSSDIANLFQISYYPTIFIICPNKKTMEVDQLSADDLWTKAVECPVAYGEYNAGIYEHNPGYGLPEICGTVALAPQFALTNLGATALTDADILLKWNGDVVQSIHWEGNLPTYGEALIQFDTFLANEIGNLNTVISSIDGNIADEDFSNNYKNNNFFAAQHFDETQVLLKIRTDNYGFETYWEVRDDVGQVLESGGNQLVGANGGGVFPLGVPNDASAYPSNTLIKDTLNLPGSGCYSIHLVDGYGDGMCCNFGNGFFKMYNISNPVQPLISTGEFMDYERHAFGAGTLSAVGEPSLQNIDIQLFPNPVAEFLFVDIDAAVAVRARARVINALGEVLYQQEQTPLTSGVKTLEIPASDLKNGLYFLELNLEDAQGNGDTHISKFIVQR